MAALTKTQINYFAERLAAAVRLRLETMNDELPKMFPEFDPEMEKIKAIASGAVELTDKVLNADTKLNSPLRKSLDDAYPDPPSVCEYKQRTSALKELLRKDYHGNFAGRWAELLHQHRRNILDRFVLGELGAADVMSEIESIREWKPADYWPLVR